MRTAEFKVLYADFKVRIVNGEVRSSKCDLYSAKFRIQRVYIHTLYLYSMYEGVLFHDEDASVAAAVGIASAAAAASASLASDKHRQLGSTDPTLSSSRTQHQPRQMRSSHLCLSLA